MSTMNVELLIDDLRQRIANIEQFESIGRVLIAKYKKEITQLEEE